MPKSKSRHSILYRNGLSLAMLGFLIFSFIGMYVSGWHDYNNERESRKQSPVTAMQYVRTGHFVSATFENWESEFLQMAIYVLLTVWLRQKGSSESKSLDESEEVEKEPQPKPDAPWPVHKGGFVLAVYKNSLSIALFLLFLLSFYLHLCGSLSNHNEQDIADGKPASTMWQHLGSSSFWFESFQNWQSEFLSVLSIVVLSIWLRQKGSPESKPVDAPDSKTGD